MQVVFSAGLSLDEVPADHQALADRVALKGAHRPHSSGLNHPNQPIRPNERTHV
jgi:hypothetical protein